MSLFDPLSNMCFLRKNHRKREKGDFIYTCTYMDIFHVNFYPIIAAKCFSWNYQVEIERQTETKRNRQRQRHGGGEYVRQRDGE